MAFFRYLIFSYELINWFLRAKKNICNNFCISNGISRSFKSYLVQCFSTTRTRAGIGNYYHTYLKDFSKFYFILTEKVLFKFVFD
jgi:hypothetical protein